MKMYKSYVEYTDRRTGETWCQWDDKCEAASKDEAIKILERILEPGGFQSRLIAVEEV